LQSFFPLCGDVCLSLHTDSCPQARSAMLHAVVDGVQSSPHSAPSSCWLPNAEGRSLRGKLVENSRKYMGNSMVVPDLNLDRSVRPGYDDTGVLVGLEEALLAVGFYMFRACGMGRRRVSGDGVRLLRVGLSIEAVGCQLGRVGDRSECGCRRNVLIGQNSKS
jgi:hypothetical protein